MTDKSALSRADTVRKRRAQQYAQRLDQATQRAYKPAPMATARNKGYIATKHKRAVVKRRFNIALGMPALHLQRPVLAFPNLREGSRMVSLVLTIIFGAVLYATWTLPYFHATWAVVNGAGRLSVEEINAALGISGQSIFTLQPDEISARLRLNYPELADADVQIYLPNHVFVNVTERQPVILWQQSDGYTWIDSTGVAFRPRGNVNGLVPVYGVAAPPVGIDLSNDPFSPPPFMSKETVSAILILAPYAPQGTSILYDPRNGFGWADPRGWQVFFGTETKDMAMKARVYLALVDSLMARGLYPVFISVAYADAPFYRMAQPIEPSDSNE